MIKILQALLIVTLAFGLSACPGDAFKKSKSGASIRVVKGDPDVFVKNTMLNGARALPAQLSDTTQWDFDIGGFKEELAENDINKVVKEQTPDEKRSLSDSTVLLGKKSQDAWSLEGRFKGSSVSLNFSRVTNGWLLKSFRIGDWNGELGKSSTQLIHTSVKPDGSAFSLLLQDKTPKKRLVYELIVSQAKPLVTGNIGNRVYEYLFGKGVRVGWNKKNPPVLQICGTLPDPLPQWIEEETGRWRQALGDRLSLSTVRKASCPPFSDLNTQTFSVVREWIEIQGESAMVAATLPIAGPGRGELMDGDIFYLFGEYEEALRLKKQPIDMFSLQALAIFQPDIRHTVLHEMGHFLGLHHQFDPSQKSIMSYDQNQKTQLYDYDVRAIQHLYENQ